MIIYILSCCLTGLMAGLFLCWSIATMPGITQLNDSQFIAAMQAMNRAIVNPVFVISYMAPLVLLPLLSWKTLHHPAFGIILTATILYIVSFLITMVCNVPLNEALDKVDVAQAGADVLKQQRLNFVSAWITWHTIRTVMMIISFVCCLCAICRH
ncbi:DUF1772 domain-containing protein [Chitinophaga sp. Cy-1792]|uniref:anthrone oxygenase family protein n=1 Tax=Chitinophaga sp. Cy-1792 TaxID=2608339 RepID=UPI001422D236|nr:DUF1772 domain-containing protein [Chitinophaga sp. Cy-1792]